MESNDQTTAALTLEQQLDIAFANGQLPMTSPPRPTPAPNDTGWSILRRAQILSK